MQAPRPRFGVATTCVDASGLLGLRDSKGACANAVKDAQRTKTHVATRHTLTIVWGAATLADSLRRATEWYGELLIRLGARTVTVKLDPS